MRTGQLFTKEMAPRRPRKVLMHVSDGGTDSVELKCGACGYKEQFSCRPKEDRFDDDDLTVTQAKRGVPCPRCNGATP